MHFHARQLAVVSKKCEVKTAPTDADLKVKGFEPSAEAGKFDFTVSVEGITVGSEATKENLKKVFGLEGASELNPAGFSAAKVDVKFADPVGGRVKFTAGPAASTAKMFFMKVRLNATSR